MKCLQVSSTLDIVSKSVLHTLYSAYKCFYSLSMRSPAFKFEKSQSMCPRQQSKEKPTTASNEKASHETNPLQGRARTTRKLQGNNVSRLCKQDQCESITILLRNASKPQLAPERERPVRAIQPQPVKRMALWL